MSRIINFLKDVRIELGRVTWPTASQTGKFTLVVIIMSTVVSLFLAGWDVVFKWVLTSFVI